MTHGERKPPDDELAHYARFAQRLQHDERFLHMIQEFTGRYPDRPAREEQAADFVKRLQRDPHFLEMVEEFTGERPERPEREAPPGEPGTSGWPPAEGIVAGPKAAAAAVAAAALVAGG